MELHKKGRSHGDAYGAPDPRGTALAVDNHGIYPKGMAIADDGTNIFGVIEAIKHHNPLAKAKKGEIPGSLRDRHNALMQAIAHHLFQYLRGGGKFTHLGETGRCRDVGERFLIKGFCREDLFDQKSGGKGTLDDQRRIQQDLATLSGVSIFRPHKMGYARIIGRVDPYQIAIVQEISSIMALPRFLFPANYTSQRHKGQSIRIHDQRRGPLNLVVYTT